MMHDTLNSLYRTYINSESCQWTDVRGIEPLSLIFVSAVVFISIITLWRVCFNKIIGNRCGRYYAKLQCGEITEPSIITKMKNKTQNQWKIDSLHYFYINNKTQIASKERKQEKLNFLKNSLDFTIEELEEYFDYLSKKQKYSDCCSKFGEELWKCITKAFITYIGALILYNADYFYDTRLLYTQYPQPSSDLLQLYYQISVGYHGHRAFAQFFVDTKRKDFVAMTIHHWVTISLIIAAWYIGFMQFGCIAMVCHDNSDVFLSIAKMCKYNQWKLLTNISFAVFALSWVIFRLFMFAWKIFYPMFFGHDIVGCNWLYPVVICGVTILMGLHLYWSNLILRVVLKSCTTEGKLEDVRSDSEGINNPYPPNQNHRITQGHKRIN